MMKHQLTLFCIAAATIFPSVGWSDSQTDLFDILVMNGRIADGTGNPRVRGFINGSGLGIEGMASAKTTKPLGRLTRAGSRSDARVYVIFNDKIEYVLTEFPCQTSCPSGAGDGEDAEMTPPCGGPRAAGGGSLRIIPCLTQRTGWHGFADFNRDTDEVFYQRHKQLLVLLKRNCNVYSCFD